MDKKYLMWINTIIVVFVLLIGISCYFVTNDSDKTKEYYIEGTVDRVGNNFFILKDGNTSYKVNVNDLYSIVEGDKVRVKTDGKSLETDPVMVVGLDVETIEKASPKNDEIEDITNDNVSNNANSGNVATDTDVNNYTEEDVITYFNNLSSEVDEATTFSAKVKAGFIKIVDFFFYDGEINGYKFKELTDKAKLEVMKIAFKIDTKISNKFPNYKETLNSKYQNFKSEMINLYMEMGTLICDNNPDMCSNVKTVFGEVKEYASIGWDYVKNLVSGGLDKLEDWYKIYSGK